MLRSLEMDSSEVDNQPPIPDASGSPALLHPYHAYVSPRGPPDTDGDGDEEQQPLGLVNNKTDSEYSKPVEQLRAYLRRQEVLKARPWWRLGSASYLLLVLVGLCYLGGRSLILRSVLSWQQVRRECFGKTSHFFLYARIYSSQSSGTSPSQPLDEPPVAVTTALTHSKLLSSSPPSLHAFLPASRLKVSLIKTSIRLVQHSESRI